MSFSRDDGRLSVISGEGKWTVLQRAQLGEETYATPALVDRRIDLRTNGHLYCFKQVTPAAKCGFQIQNREPDPSGPGSLFQFNPVA